MWASSTIPYTSLFFHQQTCTVIFMYYALYFPTFIFALHVPCFPFFNRSQSEAGVLNQLSPLFFRRGSGTGQLNVQTATAEKEKLYNLE